MQKLTGQKGTTVGFRVKETIKTQLLFVQFVCVCVSWSDLSEEEMMDLALQLSEKEASAAALRLQREEDEDVMKAIEESVSTDPEHLEPLMIRHMTREQNRRGSDNVAE